MPNLRKLADYGFAGFCAVCTGGAGLLILAIAGTLLVKGLPAFSWGFLALNEDRGIGFHVVGTLILIVSALFVAAPLATGLGIVYALFSPNGRRRRWMRTSFFALNGIPSIIFGIFGFLFFVKFLGWDKSWLAGGIVLGFMILPSMALALVERIEVLAPKYIDAAMGLGMRRSQVIWFVVMRQSVSGLVTGSLLGMARAAGEVAPIMFTATVFSGATIPLGIKDEPVLALPYHIFSLAQDTFSDASKAQLWATAVVLLGLVAALLLLALPMRIRIHEEASHA